VRFTSTNSFTSFNVMPRANLGPNVAPIQNLGSISGIGPNLGRAEAVLSELSGSVSNVVQGFYSPGGPDPVFLPGEVNGRNWRQREFGLFFKDDWKLTSSLTLNLGLRYEWYGVPWEANGKSTGLVGGSGAVFGVSGTSFADLFQPGRMAGSLTRLQLVGPGSPNPGLRLFENDNNINNCAS
jgi:outer membrane receptor protein involved in Fe transport